MHKFLINCPSNSGLDEEKVRKIADKVMASFKFKFEVELSLIFVGRTKARNFNLAYRKMNYVPQVLGFPNSRDSDPDGLVRLGDVLICTNKLKREVELVENRGKNIYQVLEKWIEHGVNNLLK